MREESGEVKKRNKGSCIIEIYIYKWERSSEKKEEKYQRSIDFPRYRRTAHARGVILQQTPNVGWSFGRSGRGI